MAGKEGELSIKLNSFPRSSAESSGLLRSGASLLRFRWESMKWQYFIQ